MNWWLIALAFVLGLALTGAFMVRRVTREVPVYGSAPKVVAPKTVPRTEPRPEPTIVESQEPSAAAGLVATETESPSGPHGEGSAKPGADGMGPTGWAVKGNEESKLYHSPESPSYGVTRAEVWFRDVATAEAAGFNRWDSGKSQRGRK